MKRLRDWQLRLAAFIRERSNVPFEWGRNDCCLFAADAVLAMTGIDPVEGRRDYSTALEAQRVVASAGGLGQLATSVLGEPIPPLQASNGDVVLIANMGRDLLAICNGTSAIGPGESGMVAISMGDAVAAWRI